MEEQLAIRKVLESLSAEKQLVKVASHTKFAGGSDDYTISLHDEHLVLEGQEPITMPYNLGTLNEISFHNPNANEAKIVAVQELAGIAMQTKAALLSATDGNTDHIKKEIRAYEEARKTASLQLMDQLSTDFSLDINVLGTNNIRLGGEQMGALEAVKKIHELPDFTEKKLNKNLLDAGLAQLEQETRYKKSNELLFNKKEGLSSSRQQFTEDTILRSFDEKLNFIKEVRSYLQNGLPEEEAVQERKKFNAKKLLIPVLAAGVALGAMFYHPNTVAVEDQTTQEQVAQIEENIPTLDEYIKKLDQRINNVQKLSGTNLNKQKKGIPVACIIDGSKDSEDVHATYLGLNNTLYWKMGEASVFDGKVWYPSESSHPEDNVTANHNVIKLIQHFESENFSLDDFVGAYLLSTKNPQRGKILISDEFVEEYTSARDFSLPEDIEAKLLENSSKAVGTELGSLSAFKEYAHTCNGKKFGELIKSVSKTIQESFEYDKASAELGEKYNKSDDIVQTLLEERKGICVNFATLNSQFWRNMGIPAKVATGFMGVDKIKDPLHAWSEVWNPYAGWTQTEATPPEGTQQDSPCVNGQGTTNVNQQVNSNKKQKRTEYTIANLEYELAAITQEVKEGNITAVHERLHAHTKVGTFYLPNFEDGDAVLQYLTERVESAEEKTAALLLSGVLIPKSRRHEDTLDTLYNNASNSLGEKEVIRFLAVDPNKEWLHEDLTLKHYDRMASALDTIEDADTAYSLVKAHFLFGNDASKEINTLIDQAGENQMEYFLAEKIERLVSDDIPLGMVDPFHGETLAELLTKSSHTFGYNIAFKEMQEKTKRILEEYEDKSLGFMENINLVSYIDCITKFKKENAIALDHADDVENLVSQYLSKKMEDIETIPTRSQYASENGSETNYLRDTQDLRIQNANTAINTFEQLSKWGLTGAPLLEKAAQLVAVYRSATADMTEDDRRRLHGLNIAENTYEVLARRTRLYERHRDSGLEKGINKLHEVKRFIEELSDVSDPFDSKW